MKISLAWLFDHIDGDWRKIDVPNLVQQFNLKTAEIEGFAKSELDLQQLTVARVEVIGEQVVTLFSPGLSQKIMLGIRPDLIIGGYYLLQKSGDGWVWASGVIVDSAKDSLLPAIYFGNDEVAAKWFELVELEDYIFEVDNKSLTNRPDMWGHRGFAREIAALLDLKLRPLEQFLTPISVQEVAQSFGGDQLNPIGVQVNTQDCRRFASLYVQQVANLPSQLGMAIRLLRLDQRAIDYSVDLSNYVMLDIGQPMHVFDAEQLVGKKLNIRQAKLDEKIALLGGVELSLQPQDMVVCDEQGPVALAGIKGGARSGSSATTRALLLEAANFAPGLIRQSSARHKLRTEASARFEKSLDPAQTTIALQRFIKLQQALDPALVVNGPIIAVGQLPSAITIELDQAWIDQRLGVALSPEFVVGTLEKLGFGVKTGIDKYLVTVPSWRATKDIQIAEDLLEELGRMWGYDKIPARLPSKLMQPGDLSKTFKVRQIKRFLATDAGMQEVENYPFYDETFLRDISWQPVKAVEVINPVSENWYRLVTSLVPHLCKNILQNGHECTNARFFEWGRTWEPKTAEHALETRILAGIFFARSGVDFYIAKNYLTKLFQSLKLAVTWQKPDQSMPIWYHPYQTASLVCDGVQIGWAGKLSSGWLREIAEGDAFAFEINGDFLLSQPATESRYQPLPRFQGSHLDVSILVPLTVTVAELQNLILRVDPRVYRVELIDTFQKDDWFDKKALTFRYYFVDQEKTLSGEEIAVVQQKVEAAVQTSGASIR